MADFISDGQPFESPIGAANEGYLNTPPTYGKAFGAMAEELSTVLPLTRAVERGQYAGASAADQGLFAFFTQNEMGEPQMGAPGSIKTPMLTAEEANKRYAPTGPDGKPAAITDKPIPEGVAQLVGKAKSAEIERNDILRRFSESRSFPITFGSGLAAFMLDPLNAASVFLPGVGEEAALANLGRIGFGTGIAARTAARAVAGGTAGAVGQAPLTALRYGLGTEEASDYDLRSAFRDMMFASAGGAILQAGFGAAGDVLRARRTMPGQAGETPPGESVHAFPGEAATILNADAATKADAMRAAVSQVVDGRPVDVEPVFGEPAGERLSIPPKVPGASPFQPLPREPARLVSWLQANGGLKDEGGDVRAILGGAKYRPGLVNNQTGMNLDDAALKAWESGYFPQHGENRPTTNDLLDAIAEDLQGKARYSGKDEAQVASYRVALEHNAEVDRLANELGISAANHTREQFYDLAADRMSTEQMAQEVAAMVEGHEAAMREAEKAARRWTEGRGDAWEPDEFYATTEPRTLEELEREYRQEEAARRQAEGAGRAAPPGSATRGEAGLQAGARPSERGAGAGRRGEAQSGEIARQQLDLYRDGFAPGISQSDFRALDDEVYGRAAAAARATPAAAAEAAGGAAATPLDRELATAEAELRAAQERGAPIHAEDLAELNRAAENMRRIETTGQAAMEAAQCLLGMV